MPDNPHGKVSGMHLLISVEWCLKCLPILWKGIPEPLEHEEFQLFTTAERGCGYISCHLVVFTAMLPSHWPLPGKPHLSGGQLFLLSLTEQCHRDKCRANDRLCCVLSESFSGNENKILFNSTVI